MNITIQGVDITLTEEQLRQLQAKLEPKQTAKEFLLEILSKPFEVKVTREYITFYQEGEWMFQQDLKNKRLWTKYSIVWRVLEEKFLMSCTGIQSIVKEVVGEALNCREYP